MAFFDNVTQVDCSALACNSTLGALEAVDPNCPANWSRSQVRELIFWHPTLVANPTTPITNWPVSGSAGLVAGDFDIDNTDTLDTKLKRIFGVGSIAEPEEEEVEVTDFQTIVVDKTYTLNFVVTDIGDLTYDYFRKVQCGKVRPNFVYGDVSKYLYGVSGGIVPLSWKPKFPKNTGKGSLNQLVIDITFSMPNDPDRVINPL